MIAARPGGIPTPRGRGGSIGRRSGGGPEHGATATAVRPPAEPLAALSDAERRVASLAAAGCTNREIAARLFVTVSTVEQHLTRTYRKLGITRRADLPLVLEFGEQAGV